MDDVVEITQLILRERQGRDRAWWKQMAECFHPDSLVSLSWFEGTGADFTARSKELTEKGIRPLHRLSPPVVHLKGAKAVVELPAAIEVRFPIQGVEVDLVSYSRLIYRVETRDGNWKVLSLNAIYERDTLMPTVPGTHMNIDPEALGKFRPSYRFLSYHLSLGGRPVRDDLYGDDQPEAVIGLYEAAFEWLNH